MVTRCPNRVPWLRIAKLQPNSQANSMSDISSEPRLSQLADKVNSLILGYKIAAFLPLTLFSLINGYSTIFLISKCREIYSDALPGQILPGVTSLVLYLQPMEIVLSCAWFLMGILAFSLPKKITTTITLTTSSLVLAPLQITITWIALIIPMLATNTGISGT